jgi:hypothetical protein
MSPRRCSERQASMIRLFLLPGDLACNAFGVPSESDHGAILRSYFNILIWGTLATAAALKIAL